ncbi:carbohydrate ABC transporter permease [Paenibacillus azoreducens]|uniref:Lactose ABC transporter permease n=1 Tax=Paenibacillus azoreducens TaxID=116718 RepID=A0A919Y8L8_9BACL|nr:sugar ABC transporter permease [Paenibacillus azoreducens]GIO47001.1 lactose ABC transporter permease [Paenibacillus azoreducens]
MKKRLGLTMRARHIVQGYSFISIWIVGFFLFMAIPLFKSLMYSFQDLKIMSGGLEATQVGLKHYNNAFTVDTSFVPKLITSFTNIVIQVPLTLVFAMFSALLLNRKLFGRIAFRGIFFLPVIIASGAVLKKLMGEGATRLPIFDQVDLVGKLIDYVPGQILFPLLKMMDAITLIMWDSGVQILIFLAGLQSISTTLYEAAKCDGATPWESFWKVTFPMIMPMILVNTLFSIVSSFTKVDNSVMDYIQYIVFNKNDYGYASALGWIYFVFIFLVIGAVFLIFRRASAEERR